MVMGDYYLDGPVFLKSGVNLLGVWSEDDSPYETAFIMHGSGTGADGVINAHGVSDILVRTPIVIADIISVATAIGFPEGFQRRRARCTVPIILRNTVYCDVTTPMSRTVTQPG